MHAQSGTYVSGPACGSYNASSPSGRNTSAGFPCPWSGYDRWAIIPAAVHVHASRGVRFSNCSFRRLGATAVAFDKGSQNCSVASCFVEDVSGNGVQIGTIDSYNETVSTPTQLKSALFHHTSRTSWLVLVGSGQARRRQRGGRQRRAERGAGVARHLRHHCILLPRHTRLAQRGETPLLRLSLFE